MVEQDLVKLLPEIKTAIEYVGAAATGGIIGNRFDNWFMNLYYHEKQRIISWLKGWELSETDKLTIESSEEMKFLFSQVTSSVANEIFEKKILLWPVITESLLRNKQFEFNEKQYFINLFLKTDPFTIHYLAKLDIEGPINYTRVFPNNENNKPSLGHEDLGLYLGQLQSAYAGTTDLYNDEDLGTTVIKISSLGKHFIDFISNSSKEKLEEMSRS